MQMKLVVNREFCLLKFRSWTPTVSTIKMVLRMFGSCEHSETNSWLVICLCSSPTKIYPYTFKPTATRNIPAVNKINNQPYLQLYPVEYFSAHLIPHKYPKSIMMIPLFDKKVLGRLKKCMICTHKCKRDVRKWSS